MSSHNSEAAYASAEIASIMQERQNHFFEGIGDIGAWSLFAGREGGNQWPLADGVISATNKQKHLDFAFEFKRANEGVHGILTALGQSYAYLEKGYDASVMAFPSKYSSKSDPGPHINRIIEATSPDIPIWIFTYDEPDLSATRPFQNKIICVRENPWNSFKSINHTSGNTNSKITTLWAHVREGMSHPDALFRFCQAVKLETAFDHNVSYGIPIELINAVSEIDNNADPFNYLSSTTSENSILERAWRRVWFSYYFWHDLIPIYHKDNTHYVVNDVPTKILIDSNNYQGLFSTRVDSIKSKLVRALNDGSISESEAWKQYALKVRKDAHSYREVIDSGLFHIGFLSSDGSLTDLGYKYVAACEKKNSAYDPYPMEILRSSFLQNGQFLALLHYIFKYSEELFNNDLYAFTERDRRGNLRFNQNEYLNELMRYFADDLHIVQKSSLRADGTRKPFQAELSYMKKLGFLRTNTSTDSVYRLGTGLCIDWPQVESSLLFFNNL